MSTFTPELASGSDAALASTEGWSISSGIGYSEQVGDLTMVTVHFTVGTVGTTPGSLFLIGMPPTKLSEQNVGLYCGRKGNLKTDVTPLLGSSTLAAAPLYDAVTLRNLTPADVQPGTIMSFSGVY